MKGKRINLYCSYNTTFFSRFKDREVFQVLDITLGLKIKIEMDEAIVRMTYNIIEAHIYFDFVTLLIEDIKINLVRIEQGDFQNSSYF